MSSETQAMSYEAMQKELEAAGYRIRIWRCDEKLCYRINFPDRRFDVIFADEHNNHESPFEELNESHLHEAIELAYAHLQREKKYATMEALLTKLIGYDTPADMEGEEDVAITTHLWNWFYTELEPEAKRILGK